MVVTVQLYIVKYGEVNEEEIVTLWKIQSNHWGGIKNKTVNGSQKIWCSNTTWLLPGDKKKFKVLFNPFEVVNERFLGEEENLWKNLLQIV